MLRRRVTKSMRYKITKRPGTHNWQLRYYVPRDHRPAYGKVEVVRSLQTPDKRLAEERALDIVKQLNREVRASGRLPQNAVPRSGFPELERSDRGYYDSASKWFAKYFARMSFARDLRGFKPTFHSFRHSAITRLGQHLSDHDIRPLVGHEERTTTKGYREEGSYSVGKRQELIELITYPGLDLRSLHVVTQPGSKER